MFETCNDLDDDCDTRVDEDFPNKGDACADSKCQPGAKITCDDNNVCTDDTCDPAKGCVFTFENSAGNATFGSFSDPDGNPIQILSRA